MIATGGRAVADRGFPYGPWDPKMLNLNYIKLFHFESFLVESKSYVEKEAASMELLTPAIATRFVRL